MHDGWQRTGASVESPMDLCMHVQANNAAPLAPQPSYGGYKGGNAVVSGIPDQISDRQGKCFACVPEEGKGGSHNAASFTFG